MGTLEIEPKSYAWEKNTTFKVLPFVRTQVVTKDTFVSSYTYSSPTNYQMQIQNSTIQSCKSTCNIFIYIFSHLNTYKACKKKLNTFKKKKAKNGLYLVLLKKITFFALETAWWLQSSTNCRESSYLERNNFIGKRIIFTLLEKTYFSL